MSERNETLDLSKTALLIIDVQMEFAFRAQNGVPRSTPDGEQNIARLQEFFRQTGGKVVHIHHHSIEPGSPFTAGTPGAEVQDFVKPLAGEAVYTKHANSGFIGTTLEADLRGGGIENLITCGGTANHCVETTTRMAENLGFNVIYAADGVWAYGDTGPDGRIHSPDDVLSVTLSNIHGEFADVLKTDEILQLVGE